MRIASMACIGAVRWAGRNRSHNHHTVAPDLAVVDSAVAVREEADKEEDDIHHLLHRHRFLLGLLPARTSTRTAASDTPPEAEEH